MANLTIWLFQHFRLPLILSECSLYGNNCRKAICHVGRSFLFNNSRRRFDWPFQLFQLFKATFPLFNIEKLEQKSTSSWKAELLPENKLRSAGCFHCSTLKSIKICIILKMQKMAKAQIMMKFALSQVFIRKILLMNP